MFSRQLLRQRPRLPQATTRLSRPQSRPRFYSSEKPQRSYQWTAGLVGFPMGWFFYDWMHSGKDSALPSLTPTPGAADGAVPDLDKLGTGAQVAFDAAPTLDDVTNQLNKHAYSYSLDGAEGVSRYDGAQVASNNPCEDAYMHGRFTLPPGGEGEKPGEWLVWAVFDGHCGWQLSHMLTTQLLPFVRNELAATKSSATGGAAPLSDEAVATALKSAFTKFDDAIVKSATAVIDSDIPYAEKVCKLEPAYAGSCALLALYNPATRTLHIASTGDCRAVLAQQKDGGGGGGGGASPAAAWETQAQTVDQTGSNEAEVERLRRQFPDEPDMIGGGRVWGMMPSRTLGDGMWKWSADLKARLRREYNGPRLPAAGRYPAYKVGPYLTAEPVVTTLRLDPGRRAALILATDGLWDTMSTEQAVGLVGRWCDEKQTAAAAATTATAAPETGFEAVTKIGYSQFSDKYATVQDDNVAVHLIRNGLGGAHKELVRGGLAFRHPNSRYVRDDITVQVAFFEPENNRKAS